MGFEEVSKMEQRLEMVEAVVAKRVTVTDASMMWGVSRQTIHGWVKRFLLEGEPGLADRSSRPRSSPAQMPWRLESRIVEMRLAHRRWGARRIRAELKRAGVNNVPAQSSIHAALIRNNLIQAKPKAQKSTRRFVRSAPGELLQVDAKDVFLTNGTKVHVLSFLDDHSRYCCAAQATTALECAAAIEVFDLVVNVHGLPYSVLADNGSCFTGRTKRTVNAFERHLWGFGVVTLNGRPYHPQTQGKVERYHGTLGDWLVDYGPYDDIESLQRSLDEFRHDYNDLRPHQGINDDTPAERLGASPWKTADPDANHEKRLRHSVRVTQNNGRLGYGEWVFNLGKVWAKQPIELFDYGHIIEIWSAEGSLLHKFDPLNEPGNINLTGKPGNRSVRG